MPLNAAEQLRSTGATPPVLVQATQSMATAPNRDIPVLPSEPAAVLHGFTRVPLAAEGGRNTATAETAFAARLTSAVEPPVIQSALSPAARTMNTLPDEAAEPACPASEMSTDTSGRESKSPTQEPHPRKDQPTISAAPLGPAAPAQPGQTAPAAVTPEPRPPARTPDAPRVEPPSPARLQSVTPPDPPTPAVPRAVELKLNIQDGRVQVHVAERAGDVHIAVHTPDTNLAGTLREDLPQLASRLEQMGYHADTWHGPAQGPPDSPYSAQSAAGSPYQNPADPRQHPSGHQQEDQSQRQQRQPAEELATAQPAQEFSWLLDSLR